jgi:hypothetical protein
MLKDPLASQEPFHAEVEFNGFIVQTWHSAYQGAMSDLTQCVHLAAAKFCLECGRQLDCVGDDGVQVFLCPLCTIKVFPVLNIMLISLQGVSKSRLSNSRK